MAKEVLTRTAYVKAAKLFVPKEGPATARAEQRAHATGKLNPLVDPAGYGVIRRSLLRMEKRKEDNLWELAVGTSMPIESRVDTTGSMGGSVDIALRVLPNAFELFGDILPGYDLHIATGIFGDVQDKFVLCRPQFEMVADKIVEQLTLMVPEKNGGDEEEDPHYGLFGAAYLTAAYINRIGLKRYDFTISDAPARHRFDERQLRRIFGEEVFEKVIENGHKIKANNLPDTREATQDLLKFAHAFFLQVGEERHVTQFWVEIFGRDRVVLLPSTELLPQVQATIIGLTEGTLDLKTVPEFLRKANIERKVAEEITRSVANIPIGAQAALANFSKRPMKGDLFEEKTDLWPVDVAKPKKSKKKKGGPGWL